uniref:CD99 molecule n=1 Tax=Iconisemion striatum TaxID=60296 RepID=A0A1A7Y0B0_9TELE
MKFTLRTVLLLFLITGTLAQDGFDLSDALDDIETTQKPAEKPKADEVPTKKPQKPSFGDSGGNGFDLGDALHPGPATDKPAVKPPKSGGGGGGSFGDSDLFDVSEGGDYKPDGGRSGGRAIDPGADHQGGADQPQEGASSPLAGIISAVVVAVVGAGSSYFAYQKKKLCFKIQGGQDPESGKGQQQGTHSEPQVFSTLLQSS